LRLMLVLHGEEMGFRGISSKQAVIRKHSIPTSPSCCYCR
jgi:hypothetical protein